MTLQQMEFFITTVRYGSFTAAAKKFYTTQPTVSRQILLLEEELGFVLLNRQEKPLSMTSGGKVIYEQFCKTVEELNEAMNHAKAVSDGKQGDLSIAFVQGLYIEDYFEAVFERILKENRDLKLRFAKIKIPDIREKLLSGQIDILVSLKLKLLKNEELVVRAILPIETFILMSVRHPLAQKESLNENDLYEENLYLPKPIECFPISQNRFFGFNINPRKLIPVDDIETAFLNARFSNGITCANSMMHTVHDSEQFKKFSILDNRFVPSVCLAWKKENQNPAISFFSDYVENYFGHAGKEPNPVEKN